MLSPALPLFLLILTEKNQKKYLENIYMKIWILKIPQINQLLQEPHTIPAD